MASLTAKSSLMIFLCVCLLKPMPLAAMELGEEITQSILKDPSMMEKVLSLTKDPAFQGVLNDPALMDAIRRGDLDLLATQPAIKQLTDHPVVQEIKEKQNKGKRP